VLQIYNKVKFIFIPTFKMRKRKQRKIIQSPSQPHLYDITLKLILSEIQL